MSWEETTLGEACELYQPKTISGKEMVADGAYPVFGANGIIGRYDQYNHEAPQLVIGCRGSCGSVHVTDPFSWITGNTMVVKPRTRELDLKFMEYMLRGGVDISETITGAAQPQITRQSLAPVRISYPPLPEQQRIVGKLDAAFAALTEAQAHVERNRANARELFESYLNGVFEGKGDGWVEKRLGDLGETRTGSTPPTNDRSNYGDYAPFVKPGDFNVDGSIEYRGNGVSKRGFELSRPIPANSILMVCVGATIGKTGFVDREVTSNQQINSLTPRSEFFPKYIYYALIARRFFESVLHNSSQATLPIISKSKWETLTVTLPKDRTMQERIANELDELSMRTKQLETTYQQKQTELAGLKKAVLGAAFRGEL